MFTAAAACAGSACCTATCSCFGAVGGAVAKISARALYVCLFVLTTLFCVVMRDYAKPMLAKLPWIVSATGFDPGTEWFGAQAVYRISMGSFSFFATMSLLLINVETKSDPRDRLLHHGNWLLKLVAWVLCLVSPFLLGADSGLIKFYIWFARVASGFFLVAQRCGTFPPNTLRLCDCPHLSTDTLFYPSPFQRDIVGFRVSVERVVGP